MPVPTRQIMDDEGKEYTYLVLVPLASLREVDVAGYRVVDIHLRHFVSI
jgi:hypothetical protein